MSGDSHMLEGAGETDYETGEEAYDALAELFLGDPADDGPTGAEPARERATEPAPRRDDEEIAGRIGASAHPRVQVEALILGHLPVMSAPWAAQHAARTAERSGETVGLIRLMGGQAAVEVFGSDVELRPAATLADAVEEGARVASRWMLCADAVDEPELVRRGADGVTLLCGADQAALVGGYRMLKGLVEGVEAGGGGPAWRVAIVGGGGEEAQRAFTRLERAAEAFLGGRLEREADVPRMGPMRVERVYRGEIEDTEEAITQVLNAIRSPRDQPEEKMQTPQGKTRDPFGPSGVSKTRRPHADPLRPSGSSDPERVGRASDVLLHAASGLRPGADAAFSEHVTGLSALAARCPYEPDVELAVDDDGGLHLLTKAGASAIESLAVVEGWLRDHGALVAMASGGRRVDASQGIAWHVLTEEPSEVRRLLDSRARVHLVASVEVDGKRGWISKRLN